MPISENLLNEIPKKYYEAVNRNSGESVCVSKLRCFSVRLVSLCSGGVASGYARWHGKVRPYPEIRSQRIETLAATYPVFDTLLLGDSIGEGITLSGACGSTFNAAISYNQSRDVHMIGNPKRVVLFIGANDWPHQYQNDVSALLKRLPRPLVFVDTSRSPETKAFAARLARRMGVRLVSTVGIETIDGVHPTITGARALKARVEQACGDVAES